VVFICFFLRKDVSETLLKSGVTDLFFEKKMVRESLKNTRALMVWSGMMAH